MSSEEEITDTESDTEDTESEAEVASDSAEEIDDFEEIGKISVDDDGYIQWTMNIEDISSYLKKEGEVFLFSPVFLEASGQWFFEMNPNHASEDNSFKWIGLVLHRCDESGSNKVVNYTFGVKRTDGTVEPLKHGTEEFSIKCGSRVIELLEVSELLSRKVDLAPADALTITCSLNVIRTVDSFASTWYFAKSSELEIGEISVEDDRRFEWTIKDILSYIAKNGYYFSPPFHFFRTRWYLGIRISPNGKTRDNRLDWIGLYLYRDDDGTAPPPQGAIYTFGIKKADGTIEQMKEDLIYVYEEDENSYGQPKCIQRSELLGRKTELTTADNLTITCSFKVNKSFDSSDASMDPLSKHFFDMYTSGKGSDIRLKVKDQEFWVHKCILIARSPVFAEMLRRGRSRVVCIKHCEPTAFEDFLVYLYTGIAQNVPTNALELCTIADTYGARDLRSTCLLYLMGHLSLQNVLDCAVLADRLSSNGLKFKSQKFFNKNFCEIVFTAEFESLMMRKSKSLVALDLIQGMASEMELEK